MTTQVNSLGWATYETVDGMICRLIERIARSEQALAELQTQLSQEKERNAACGKENCFGHKINGVQTWVTLQRLEREMSENARLTEALAASQARVEELQKAA